MHACPLGQPGQALTCSCPTPAPGRCRSQPPASRWGAGRRGWPPRRHPPAAPARAGTPARRQRCATDARVRPQTRQLRRGHRRPAEQQQRAAQVGRAWPQAQRVLPGTAASGRLPAASRPHLHAAGVGGQAGAGRLRRASQAGAHSRRLQGHRLPAGQLAVALLGRIHRVDALVLLLQGRWLCCRGLFQASARPSSAGLNRETVPISSPLWPHPHRAHAELR